MARKLGSRFSSLVTKVSSVLPTLRIAIETIDSVLRLLLVIIEPIDQINNEAEDGAVIFRTFEITIQPFKLIPYVGKFIY